MLESKTMWLILVIFVWMPQFGAASTTAVERQCSQGSFYNLRSQACETCPAGFYCLPGSLSPLECGSPTHYCPAGSHIPRRVSRGYFAGTARDSRFSIAWNAETQYPCPRGSFCPISEDGQATGEKLPCPAGVYGNAEFEIHSHCTAPCEAGYFCLEGSDTPRQYECGNSSVFCVHGSSEPSRVPDGSFSVGGSSHRTRSSHDLCSEGFYCLGGLPHKCDAGLYGGTRGLKTPACSGPCAAGFYCPPGSVSPTQHSCGLNASFFCSSGSATPQHVSRGYYTIRSDLVDVIREDAGYSRERICPRGSWCVGGVRRLCAPGFHGAELGMYESANCSGLCSPGFYCGAGSATPTEFQCGDSKLYCPDGSSSPSVAPPGWYTVDSSGSDDGDASLRADIRPCEPGHFCTDGIRIACRGGLYGGVGQLEVPTCSGLCERGYYCPVASTSARERECGDPSTFCPRGSSAPTSVADGYYTVGDSMTHAQNYSESVNGGWYFSEETLVGAERTRWEQRICEPGHFCVDGKRFECPPGVYGSSDGLRSIECDGSCSAGYFCDAKSTSPTQNECGAVDLYCPKRSGRPLDVSVGFFSVDAYGSRNGPETQRADVRPCDPGHFCRGAERFPCPEGVYGGHGELTDPMCSGLCERGYYCPVASTSARERDCGDPSTFCPRGSSTPTPVADGYYTVGDAMISRSSAEAFRLEMSQNDSESVSGAWYFSEETLVGAERNRWEQRICEPGHFCVDGKRFECPPGVYGSSDGLRSIECDGSCSAGYFCDAKSTLPTQSECGAVDLYCPERSAIPRKVTRGRYTIGGDSNQTKTDEAECEPGHYCIGGIRYQCPPGTYGSAISLAGPINYGHNRDGNGHFRCDGWCPEGHMCVSGTSEPVPCPVGTYAYAGASECMLCPPRYSEEDMPPVDACVNSRDCCNY